MVIVFKKNGLNRGINKSISNSQKADWAAPKLNNSAYIRRIDFQVICPFATQSFILKSTSQIL